MGVGRVKLTPSGHIHLPFARYILRGSACQDPFCVQGTIRGRVQAKGIDPDRFRRVSHSPSHQDTTNSTDITSTKKNSNGSRYPRRSTLKSRPKRRRRKKRRKRRKRKTRREPKKRRRQKKQRARKQKSRRRCRRRQIQHLLLHLLREEIQRTRNHRVSSPSLLMQGKLKDSNRILPHPSLDSRSRTPIHPLRRKLLRRNRSRQIRRGRRL